MHASTRFRHRVRALLVATLAAMMLTTGLVPAAYAGGKHRHGGVAKGGDGGDGGLIGVGVGVCVIAKCKGVGSGNAAGGDGGDARIDD